MGKDTAHVLCLRLNAKEAEKLKADAKQCGMNRSVYMRRLIMKKKVRARPAEAIQELYREINHIGNNINQIARSVNAGIATPETAEQALFLLKQVYVLMKRIADG